MNPELIALMLAIGAVGGVAYLVARFIAARFTSSRWAALLAFLLVLSCSVLAGEMGLTSGAAALICLLIDLAHQPPKRG